MRFNRRRCCSIAILEPSLPHPETGIAKGMSTYREEQHRTGWGRTHWLVLGAVLVAIAVAVVLLVVYSGGGGGSGGGAGY